MRKKLYFSCCVFLLLFSLKSVAEINGKMLLPPKYLSVPQWKYCVGTMTKGNAKFVCLPAKKPRACQNSSWKRLIELKELNSCH